jgi:hypothetical protein
MGYHLDSMSQNPMTGVLIGADGYPTKTVIMALTQCGSSNRERGPGSVLIHILWKELDPNDGWTRITGKEGK